MKADMNISLDPHVKQEYQEICKSNGIIPSTRIQWFMKKDIETLKYLNHDETERVLDKIRLKGLRGKTRTVPMLIYIDKELKLIYKQMCKMTQFSASLRIQRFIQMDIKTIQKLRLGV